MPANEARNTQSKTVQTVNQLSNQLIDNELTPPNAARQQQKSKSKRTPSSTPTTPITPTSHQPIIKTTIFSSR